MVVSDNDLSGYTIIMVNREYFVAKMFSDSLPYVKIKLDARKYLCNINNITVQGCLSENYLT